MLSVESNTQVSAAPAARGPVGAVNVYCVEVTAENTEKMRALLDTVQRGSVPSADELTKAGMQGMELTAAPDTTIEAIRDVVERQWLSTAHTDARTSTAMADADDGGLTFFAVARGTVAPKDDAAAAAADEDPLVALPVELSLEEVLQCPQIFTGRAASTTREEASPTLLLFYAHSAKWGGHCCCCGGLIAAILAMFCCCCRSRSKPRASARHSRTSSGNPLYGKDNDDYACNNNSNASMTGSQQNVYYRQYPSNAVPPPQPVPVAVAVPAPPQMYYPPQPAYNGTDYNNNNGGYYKATQY